MSWYKLATTVGGLALAIYQACEAAYKAGGKTAAEFRTAAEAEAKRIMGPWLVTTDAAEDSRFPDGSSG